MSGQLSLFYLLISQSSSTRQIEEDEDETVMGTVDYTTGLLGHIHTADQSRSRTMFLSTNLCRITADFGTIDIPPSTGLVKVREDAGQPCIDGMPKFIILSHDEGV